MALNIVEKILQNHLVAGEMKAGTEIAIRIDQTLTQDATGTMAYLQFEAMGLPKVKTKLSVSYVDHNTLQTDFRNADDHLFLQSVAAKYGIWFSKPGNGICHQVHLERFGVPGETLLGSDSHTPTGGGIGMIAIGAGGLDVAVAMGGGPFFLPTPKVVLVNLTGKLKPWVAAKDIILELLRRLTVKGGVGKIFEYGGPGVKTLSVPERATITNMGAELGATTSVFPSDETTKAFMKAQRRMKSWKRLEADPGARYDEVVDIDLAKLVPQVARPHSPDNVCPVTELKGTKVQQVAIGSCTNSSYRDMMVVAGVLKKHQVHPDVSLVISPGSRQVLEMIARNGAAADMIKAGARILETTCGPCIGMGQAPPTEGVSIRTFNRNFEGRSGTPSGQVFLASPEVAVASAVAGTFSDPRKLGRPITVRQPATFLIDDSMVLPPSKKPASVEIVRGPNIKPLPLGIPMPKDLKQRVLLMVGDNITTDHIMPAGSKILPLRSNIPAMAEHVFEQVDPGFPKRALEMEGGCVIGVKLILAKSFARIHKANLVNFGILPLVFESTDDVKKMRMGDILEIRDVERQLKSGGPIVVRNLASETELRAKCELSSRQIAVVLAGGLLNFTKKGAAKG
jgi:aconitate hydratase